MIILIIQMTDDYFCYYHCTEHNKLTLFLLTIICSYVSQMSCIVSAICKARGVKIFNFSLSAMFFFCGGGGQFNSKRCANKTFHNHCNVCKDVETHVWSRWFSDLGSITRSITALTELYIDVLIFIRTITKPDKNKPQPSCSERKPSAPQALKWIATLYYFLQSSTFVENVTCWYLKILPPLYVCTMSEYSFVVLKHR